MNQKIVYALSGIASIIGILAIVILTQQIRINEYLIKMYRL